MIARMSLLFLMGCSEYTVTLSQTGMTPVPVLIGSNVEMPAGILATVVPIVEKDGEEIDARVELESVDVRVVAVEPVESEVEDEWAILAVAPGLADITVIVDDRHEVPINVLVTEQ
jgi:hypothetical protein